VSKFRTISKKGAAQIVTRNCQQFWKTTVGTRLESAAGLSTTLKSYISGAQQLWFHWGASREPQFAGCHPIAAGGEHVAGELDGIVDAFGGFFEKSN
jgi:hypothetical protein